MQRHFREPEHFTADAWLRFLDNPRDAESDAPGRHAVGCEDCASLLESLTAIRRGLEMDAGQIRSTLAPGPTDIDVLLNRCLAQIRSAPRSRWSVAEATLLLRVLLEPICGRGTAGATINLAQRRSTAAAQNQINSGNWNVFISNLSDAMSSICGAAAGTLVERAGFSIALQEG
jgi:hypothetical protein